MLLDIVGTTEGKKREENEGDVDGILVAAVGFIDLVTPLRRIYIAART